MLFYIVIFCVIGFIIGAIIKNSTMAVTAIVAISFVWSLVFGPWALAAFIELMIGYGAARAVMPKSQEQNKPQDGDRPF